MRKGPEFALKGIMTSPEKRESFLQRLAEAGIDVNELLPNGQEQGKGK